MEATFLGERPGNFNVVLSSFSLVLVFAGCVNCYLLQPARLLGQKDLLLWWICIAVKVVLYLLFSPLLDFLLEAIGAMEMKVSLHAVFVLITLIVSAYAKQLRDAASQKGDS